MLQRPVPRAFIGQAVAQKTLDSGEPSALFDEPWYLAQLGDDAPCALCDPLSHYLEIGSAAGLTPHPLFDGGWYRQHNQDVAAAGIEPLSHFMRQGAFEGRDPHPLFDTQLYRSQCAEARAAGVNPLLHFLQQAGVGADGDRLVETHPRFDAAWYRATYPWTDLTGLSALEHYLRFGASQGLDPSPTFNSAWYLAQVPGLNPVQQNPLVHFIRVGRALGLSPRPVTGVESGPAVLLGSSRRQSTPETRILMARPGANGRAEPLPSASPREPVAVVAHLHHVTLLWELMAFLRQMPVPFRLYVSTGTPMHQAAVLRAAARALPGTEVDCRVTPNRGRDWGPLLVAFAGAAAAHSLICHVHSKRSGHFSFGEQWRQSLFEHLLGSKTVVEAILGLFEADARLGLVYPETFAAVAEHHVWGANETNTRALLRRVGLEPGLVDRFPLAFPAGSMFWCRSEALRPLWQAGLGWDDFPAEPVGEDGTLMHAIERALGFIVRGGGYRLQQVQVALARNAAVC